MWAYLPVGPLERHVWEGGQWGIGEEVHIRTFKRGWIPFGDGTISGKPLLITRIDARGEQKLHASPKIVFRGYSGFDSALYRNLDAKGHFPQENDPSHDLKMATCESKPP
jgi:hypothetical protein